MLFLYVVVVAVCVADRQSTFSFLLLRLLQKKLLSALRRLDVGGSSRSGGGGWQPASYSQALLDGCWKIEGETATIMMTMMRLSFFPTDSKAAIYRSIRLAG